MYNTRVALRDRRQRPSGSPCSHRGRRIAPRCRRARRHARRHTSCATHRWKALIKTAPTGYRLVYTAALVVPENSYEDPKKLDFAHRRRRIKFGLIRAGERHLHMLVIGIGARERHLFRWKVPHCAVLEQHTVKQCIGIQ